MLIEAMNNGVPEKRLGALKTLVLSTENFGADVVQTDEVNNHVHTIYSFSPYAPTMAAFKAYLAGLKAVGIMDHDSVSGGFEMIEACRLLGIASTVGFELRVNFSGTAVEGRKLNNPDSFNIGYIAIHGIPEQYIETAKRFLVPLQEARNTRNRRMVERLNGVISRSGLGEIVFERDVLAISCATEGGSVTERHVLYAFANKLIRQTGKGERLIHFLEERLEVPVQGKIRNFLEDDTNVHYEYDLLGLLKSSFIDRIFIQPNSEECIPVKAVVDFAVSIGAIPAYAYLGDVTDSPTGDKKAEKFEDDYLGELMAELKRLGFQAVTYMPPRNTLEQLKRIQRLCDEYGFMQISGVDINSSRQSFNCPIILQPEFRNLVVSTWALIAHEKFSRLHMKYGLFNPENPMKNAPLRERIATYAELGMKIDHRSPENVMHLIKH